MNNKNGFAPVVLIVVVALLLIGGAAVFYKNKPVVQISSDLPAPVVVTTSTQVADTNTNPATPANPAASTMKVKIALLFDPAKDGDGERMQGCDIVALEERIVPASSMPLTAALKELFAKREPWPSTESANGSFISSQKNLFFDRAAIVNGVANVYLIGSYQMVGVCDHPRIEVQVRNTAMQFSTVKSVKIFLNGSPLVIPGESGL